MPLRASRGVSQLLAGKGWLIRDETVAERLSAMKWGMLALRKLYSGKAESAGPVVRRVALAEYCNYAKRV